MSFLVRPGHPDPGHTVREATLWPLGGRGFYRRWGKVEKGSLPQGGLPEEEARWASIRNSSLHARVPYGCQMPHVMSLSLCPGVGDISASPSCLSGHGLKEEE